ncbi:hypothetical protein [Pendulispora brunnea]|uniref:hypothetical protein n=1 Tax=Pendulispora brunnea TaxID=2905690 RepID=UPI00374E00D7
MAALRYTRQVRLADVGPSGQARLGGLRAHVAGNDLAARVEALYLVGAGASVEVEDEGIAAAARGLNPETNVSLSPIPIPLPKTREPREGERDREREELAEGPAEVAAGARRALLKMRAAVEGT